MTHERLGSLLKEIRQSRKFTLKTLAGDTLSVAHLSKFENGTTNLTINKLFPLLDRLNVTYEEFFIESNAYNQTEVEALLQKIHTFYTKNDVSQLESLLDKQLKTYEDTNILFHRLNAVMIASILEELTKTPYVTDEMRESLAEYLFEVEEWRFYEAILFGNSMHTLTIETLKLITRELMKSSILSAKILKNRQMRIQTLYNIALTMLANDEHEFADDLINEMNIVLRKDESMILERIKIRYIKGYYTYLKGRKNEGNKMMKEAIETLTLYNCDNIAKSFTEHYKANTT